MDCSVIKDLLPLYIENLTSEPSNNLILEHINNCEDCNQALKKLKSDIVTGDKEVEFDLAEELPNKLIKRVKKSIYEKLFISGSILLIVGVLIGILSSKVGMFMAFLGWISITAFILAILISISICRKKPSMRKRFHLLGNWTFVLSVIISLLLCLLFIEYFNEINKIVIILIIEILYNIIFSSTLRVYARLKLPKHAIIDQENLSNKKLFIVTLSTLIVIISLVVIPVTIFEINRTVDNIDLPFSNDSEVIGTWKTVDLVGSPEQFKPGKQLFVGNFFLKGMTFINNGQMNQNFDSTEEDKTIDTPDSWLSWTKGYVIHNGGNHTASSYNISEINGSKYMFFEWKNGETAYLHRPSSYYVLKKEVMAK